MPPSIATTPHVAFFLRKTTVFSFPPAFVLCILHGMIAECAVPALGLIPLMLSSLLGAFLMYRDQISFGGSPIHLTRAQVCIADFCIAAFLMTILVLSWIFVTQTYRRGAIVLGTYATVPLMLNFTIHAWFFFSNGFCFLSFHEGCPNCRQALHTQESTPALRDMDSSYRDDLEEQPARSEDYVRLP